VVYSHHSILEVCTVTLQVARALGALSLSVVLISCGVDGADAPTLSPSPGRVAGTAAALPTPTPTPSPPPTPSPTQSPLPTLAPPVLVPGTPWTGPGKMPILMYHHVTDVAPVSNEEAPLTVTDSEFARQLTYLRCAGYYSITLSQLFDAIYNGAALPEKPVVLTFDDGHRDAYTDAFPLLRSAGFGGTFSIVTQWVGGPASVTWEQLREMVAGGMEIASHSVSHPDFGKQPDDVVRDQLSRSKRELEEKLGQPVSFFVYPAGEPFRFGSAQRQAQVVPMVQEAGYRGAVTARWQLLQDPAAPFALNRVRVSRGIDIQTFAGHMGGPPPEAIGC